MPVSQNVYQLHIVLLESSPLIWRRIQVSSEMTLPRLHLALQIAMGWENSHLHEFIASDKTIYAEPDPEDHHFGRKISDQTRVPIRKLLPAPGSSCEYHYDFGDNWRHEITLESILPLAPRKRYPVCLDGQLSAPPEDTGGMDGYKRYRDALFDTNHKDHRDLLQWRGRFDPGHFAITAVNKTLREEFPPPTAAVKKPSKIARSSSPSTAATSFEAEFNRIVRSLMQSGRLPETKRIQVGPEHLIALPLSARDRELIVDYSFADTELTGRLVVDSDTGKPRKFHFTFDELDELSGCVAAEANHAAQKKVKKEWQDLFERIVATLDRYSPE